MPLSLHIVIKHKVDISISFANISSITIFDGRFKVSDDLVYNIKMISVGAAVCIDISCSISVLV